MLLQFFSLFSYFTDGYAYAGESLAGRYIGMRDERKLTSLIRQLFGIGLLLASLGTFLYLLFPHAILSLLSDQEEIIDYAMKYIVWVGLVPLAGFPTFLWDGIFVGATFSKGLLWSMIVACVGFFVLYFSTRYALGNHALWLSFVIYLALRGAVQWAMWTRQRLRFIPK